MSNSQDWRARKRDDTHRRIYDTALRLFQEHGFEAGQRRADRRAEPASRCRRSTRTSRPRNTSSCSCRRRTTSRHCSPTSRPTSRWPTGSAVPSPSGCRQWTPEFREDALARWRIIAATPSLRTRAAEFERATGGRGGRRAAHEPARRCGRPTRSSSNAYLAAFTAGAAGLGRLQRRAQARGAHRGGVRRPAAPLTAAAHRGARSSTTVTSGRAPTRIGGPQ